MKVLVIGSGGREHALAWCLARGGSVDEVLVAPGNPGTASEPGVRNVAVAIDDFDALVQLARSEDVGLTVVGPEAPLVAGITDRFVAAGLPCFGPTRAAAQLEGSKAFSKDFLARHRIPTARYRVFEAAELDAALAYVEAEGAPIVVKADGLAAGKGVVVAATVEAACAAVRDALSGAAFGASGERVVIESFLEGEEASFIVVSDGERIVPFASSQDHKARDDGDLGPNTGGMGAYSPAPVVTDAVAERVLAEVIRPTIDGMRAEGHPYRGFLYAGLMIDASGRPSVVEFNCRFGDPEAQAVLMRLQGDLAQLCLAAAAGDLSRVAAPAWDPRPALGVVLAAPGYPAAYPKHLPLAAWEPDSLAADADEVHVFHAGTQRDADGALVSSGGRVLCVTALGADIAAAQRRAYEVIGTRGGTPLYHRSDIGHRAIRRGAD